MTCCIVGLLILSLVSRVRRVLGRRVDEPVLFAPVARRAAPGETLPEPVDVARPTGVSHTSPVLGYVAAGIALCLVGYPLLANAGVLTNTGSTLPWLMRSGLYLAVLFTALRLRGSMPIWRAPKGVGTLLVVVGAVIFELGMLDVHVFRLFAVDSSDVMAFMVFHNAGPVLAMLGGAVLFYGAAGRTSTSSRSPRSTVTSALPSSSALTVSSTPPATT